MSQKSAPIWGHPLSQPPEQAMLAFCAGRDVVALPMADAALLPYDLWTNRAHAIMLHRQGILKKPWLAAILEALAALESDWEAGKFALDPALEDVHVNVEHYVTGRAGHEAGGRIHTGRSRNDQVACDMRLFLRGSLLELAEAVGALAASLLAQAAEHTATAMPGFSHHQPAMITSWGHWLCAYVQALLRDLERATFALGLLDRNPLGAAAGFGTSWAIDREFTAELLAFERVDANTLDAISSRWEHEAEVAHLVVSLMNHLSLMAQDLILLGHPYWGLLSLHESYTTGSSIMPQKRNPDFAEVVKGKTAWAVGVAAGLSNMPRGAMSGYNRDSQQTKYAVMDLLRECLPAPVVIKGAFETLRVHPEAMAGALKKGFLLAADFADALARQAGLPFRECYDIAAAAVRLSAPAEEITPTAARKALDDAGQDAAGLEEVLAALADPARVLAWRTHSGAPGEEALRKHLEQLREEHAGLTAFIPRRKAEIEQAYRRCRDYAAAEMGK